MATALDMIKRSLRMLSAIGQGKEPTASESSDALNVLNSMLSAWSIDRLAVYMVLEETFTWASGQSSRTIGSGGNLNTTNPSRIEDGFTRISGIDYPYRVVDKDFYDAIANKTVTSSYPDFIYFSQAEPLGTLYAYPVPNASISIHINSWKQLQSFTNLSDSVVLPIGYQRAIEYNLAVELQAEYPDLTLSDIVIRNARESLSAIKTVNTTTLISNLGLSAGRRYNIYSDA